jgi:hypothetical protein
MFLACFTAGSTSTLAAPDSATPLTLINGWTNAPHGTGNAAVEMVNGIVHFRGAIATTGANSEPFVMPAAFRPTIGTYVDIPITLCNGAHGAIIVSHFGQVSIAAEHSFSSAQCMTSLDGASYAPNDASYTSLPLINGWFTGDTNRNPAFKKINGVVHFAGNMTGGPNPVPFVLPVGFRPATTVYVPVDLGSTSNGRLMIEPNGTVTVQSEGSFSNASDNTSFDGAWFVAANTGYSNLKLLNGWGDYGSGTATPAADSANGAFPVYLKGAMFTTGANPKPFVLPAADRPVHNVYINVDLCSATAGQLFIQPNGVVTVKAETHFSNAQCFTSLDGASFIQ